MAEISQLDTTQHFTQLVNKMRDVGENPHKIEPLIKTCSKNIKLMKVALKSANSIGVKQHITNCISMLDCHRTKLKSLRVTVGSGYKTTHPNRNNYASLRVKWVDQVSAFLSRIRTGVVVNLKHKDVSSFLDDTKNLFNRRIKNALKKDEALKVNASFCGEFVIVRNGEEILEYKYMKTKNAAIYRNTDVIQWFEVNVKNAVLTQLEEFQERDSGWSLKSILNITFNINKFTPMLGSSYMELPTQIKKKEACINVRNNDDACFAWAVISALCPVAKNADRMSSYPHYSTVLNLKNITMPVTMKQIPRFEEQNDISINVYILEKKSSKKFNVTPTYLTKRKHIKHVNLLLTEDVYFDEEYESVPSVPRYHYVWIKNLSRLVSSQLSKHNGKKYFCDRCLHYFQSELKLKFHEEDCVNMNNCKIRLPTTETNNVCFQNHQHKEKTPFVIYADVECLLKPVSNHYKNEYQEHIPYSIGYYVKCSYDDSLSFYKSYRGKDCQQWFTKELKNFAEDVETVFLCPLPIDQLTEMQEKEFYTSIRCHICEELFSVSDIKVRDHCHLTGKYRGPAHENCNLNYQDSHTIPVLFHNLSGYDSHFIIESLANDFEGRVDLLPVTKENYISFTKHLTEHLIKYRFIDSNRFLSSGLEKLATYLDKYSILKSQFLNVDESNFNLLTRKGVFPYDYCDSWKKLDETSLPNINVFYNNLNEVHISAEEHAHAINVWQKFGCKSLGEYSDLYLKTDVLLLADIFEEFRKSCLNTYGLDPAHYYTLPGYTWDCMLKFTKVNLELLTDIDMVMFVERAIRGGLSQCSHRYAKANNKYMENYNALDESTFLSYFDINNQYGWAMSQYLPINGFEWVDNVKNFNWNLADDSSEGCILEVDLEYPQALHDIHKDLPFCPEHDVSPKSKEQKLLATLYNKSRYVIHYRNLKQAIDNGLKLTKIHRILKFKQSPWLKGYIDLNTKLRTSAKNEFEKNLFKLMNNAVFGKTMENIRKHSIVKLVTKWDGRFGAESLISKPNFKSCTIFSNDLVAIEMNKSEIYFNKPIYVGMAILDISKLKIYDFHYSYTKSRFGDKAQLCYTDTDSLIYKIACADLYKVIKEDAEKYFDTSDYSTDNIYQIPSVNKKVLGMMKDECNGKIMSEFVGLRSKMYAYKVDGKDKDKKAKGVKRKLVETQITFDDYAKCLKTGLETTIRQNLIKSNNHTVKSITQIKTALSPHDTKRYICNDGITTLPWGHYAIMDTSV